MTDKRGQCLARAGLADDRQPVPALDGERHVVDDDLVTEANGEIRRPRGAQSRSAPGVVVGAAPTSGLTSAVSGIAPAPADGAPAPRSLRSCGSVASRSPSPSRLNPSVASTRISPGKTTAPGCTVTSAAARRASGPTTAGNVTSPRGTTERASARIAKAATSESWTMTIGATLGSRCRRIVRQVDVPDAWAARM